MKSKFRKYLLTSVLIIIFFLIIFIFINKKIISLYNYHSNLYLNNIISLIIDKYPNIQKEEIIKILNDSNLDKENILYEYGINLENDSLVLKNELIIKYFLVINIILFLVLIIIIMIIYFKYLNKKDLEIKNIESYLKSINNGIYKLEIDTNEVDELSSLKNEIYKITVYLKEQARISKHDKLLLKTSLEDLSHQLKTPLTSISIMLDNLDGEINHELKQEFLKDIKREVLKINFLVDNLLKLSKFDANTITFNNKLFFINDLVFESIKNVSMLAELKNINLISKGNLSNQMIGDFKWQIEAITNILKNCIEYSYNDSKIEIEHDENKLYSSIIIKDYGKGMDKDDLKHLFERFYKGKNSSSNSVGIGMSLAKTIIEHNNGYISVSSKVNKGTTFTIKYMK